MCYARHNKIYASFSNAVPSFFFLLNNVGSPNNSQECIFASFHVTPNKISNVEDFRTIAFGEYLFLRYPERRLHHHVSSVYTMRMMAEDGTKHDEASGHNNGHCVRTS